MMSLEQQGRRAVTRISIQVLGVFELRLDDAPVVLPAPAQRVLAYLAVAKAPQQREQLAGRLWPLMSQARAQACLRTALWRIRQANEGLLYTSHSGVRLRQDLEVDLWEMTAYARQLIGEAAGVEVSAGAMQLLEYDVLPCWDEDWLGLERERLRQLRVHALEELSRRLRHAGRFGSAVEAAYAAIEAEPLRESAHGVLIEAHLAEGNRSEAVHHLAAYRCLLENELGIRASPNLEALVGQHQ